jgi:hypothetical protein
MGDYRAGHGGFKESGPPVLSLKIAGKVTQYEAPGLVKGAWSHLALWRGAIDKYWNQVSYEVWLNGEKLTAIATFTDSDGNTQFIEGNDPVENVEDIQVPPAWMRLGRAPKRDYEFYGLIDDVRVFDSALEPGLLSAAAAGNEGGLPNPLYRYTFDEEGEGSSYGAGYVIFNDDVRVPIDGDSSDASIFRDPTFVSPTQADYVLPFPKGEAWKVIQEFDVPSGSHNGYAAWCWDFVKASGKTAGTVFTAAADGQVISVVENDIPAPGENESNKVGIVHVQGWEVTSYLHLQHDSWTDVFLGGVPQLFQPDPDHSWTWVGVNEGDELAVVGDNAKHLHFGMRPGEHATHTAPMAFVSYEASDDGGISFQPVKRGMPRKGQIIRR